MNLTAAHAIGAGIAVVVASMFLGLAVLFVRSATGGTLPQASAPATDSATTTLRATPATSAPTLAPTSTDAPTPIPTATPILTPDGTRQMVKSYVDVVTRDSTTLRQAMSDMGLYCGNQDVAQCRTALQAVETEADRFRSDLDQTSPPACLSDPDTRLRQSLKQYHDGAQEGVQGIDSNDAGMINMGGDTMNTGTSAMNQASDMVRQAACS